MDRRKAFVPLVLCLVLVSLVTVTVNAEKPYKKYRYHGVDPDPYSDGKWITHITIISFSTDDPGVYRVVASFMMAYVGSEDMWERNIHYTGTSSSWSSIQEPYLMTGKMEYNLQYTVFGDPAEDDGWDGNYRLRFEDGEIVKKEGKGLLWLP